MIWSELFSIALIFAQKYTGVPDFIRMSQKLRPVGCTQDRQAQVYRKDGSIL